MADDQVQILVVLAVLLGEALGHGLLVQGVENADALEQGMAGIAGHVGQLVHHHGVDDVGGDAQRIADLAGDDAAQIGGMLALHADGAVVHQIVVDSVGAAADGTQQTAAAGNGRQGVDIEILLPQRLQHQLATPVLLGGDGVELGDILGAVTQGLVKQQSLVLIDTDLGGSGTGIDNKDLERHFLFLLCMVIRHHKKFPTHIIQNFLPAVKREFTQKTAVTVDKLYILEYDA